MYIIIEINFKNISFLFNSRYLKKISVAEVYKASHLIQKRAKPTENHESKCKNMQNPAKAIKINKS